jgi:hypothetical protein
MDLAFPDYIKSNRLYFDYLSVIYLIMSIPFNFVAVFVIEKKGLRTAMLIGATLQLLGFWMRWFIHYHYVWLMIGQTFLAIGNPFIYNMP